MECLGFILCNVYCIVKFDFNVLSLIWSVYGLFCVRYIVL